jgi:hypothetical protein
MLPHAKGQSGEQPDATGHGTRDGSISGARGLAVRSSVWFTPTLQPPEPPWDNVTVPVHAGKTLAIGTQKGIMRDAGLTVKRLRDLL